MPVIFVWGVLAISFWVGVAIGFCEEWLKPTPPPVSILYCTPTSTDPRCVSAMARYREASASAPAPTDSAPAPLTPEP